MRCCLILESAALKKKKSSHYPMEREIKLKECEQYIALQPGTCSYPRTQEARQSIAASLRPRQVYTANSSQLGILSQ